MSYDVDMWVSIAISNSFMQLEASLLLRSHKSHIGKLKPCIPTYKILSLYIHCQLVLRLDAPNLIWY